MRFVEVRGRAEQACSDPAGPESGAGPAIIRIHPRRVVSWNVGGGEPRFRAYTLEDPAHDADPPTRPSVSLGESAAAAATAAAARFVEEIQAGLDNHDAEVYNRHFAADVIWGSPYGAAVTGYDDLHAIHARLHRQRVAGWSRYEIVQVLCPAPAIALAHVRRVALDAEGRPVPASADPAAPFSEMALYVLVRRDGQWWLAAGQNTPVRPAPAG